MAEPIASLPVAASTEVISPVVIVTDPPKRKRRRWIGVLIGLFVLVVLLVVGFFVGDAYAKRYATDLVRTRIIEVLGLDPKSDVDVDLGEGSVLLQAVRGGLDEVTVRVPEITFGEITGTATLVATKVPLDSTQPVDTLRITATVDEENVKKLSGFLSGIQLNDIELADELIRIHSEFSLIFFTLPVAVDLQPTAVDGGIYFDPVTILLGDDEISVADLRNSPEFSSLAGDLLQSRDFCVAGFLPQALTIDRVEVVGKTLVVGIDGDGTALSDPALSTLGTCPAS